MEKITITVGLNTEILKAPRQGLDVADSWSATVVLLSPLCWYTGGRVMCFLSKLHTSTWKWQEKHKPRSEKDKKNMGKCLETHFSTLFFFFTQIIKIWLATFGTKILFKLHRSSVLLGHILLSQNMKYANLCQQNFFEHLACAKY